MNVLDENVIAQQCEQLKKWHIPFRKIGKDISNYGTLDENLIPLLHRLPQPTFFSHDDYFFKKTLCHSHYALVYLDVEDNEAAEYIRRFLKHPIFATQANARGWSPVSVGEECNFGVKGSHLFNQHNGPCKPVLMRQDRNAALSMNQQLYILRQIACNASGHITFKQLCQGPAVRHS